MDEALGNNPELIFVDDINDSKDPLSGYWPTNGL